MKFFHRLVICTLLLMGFFLLAIVELRAQSNFELQLAEARAIDAIATNQIKRIKSVIIELEKTDFHDTLGFAHYFIAFRYLFKLDDPRSAISHALKAEELFKKSDYKGKRRTWVYCYIIEAQSKLGNYNEVLLHYEKNHATKDFSEILNDEPTILRSVADSYRITGDLKASQIILDDYLLNETLVDISPDNIGMLYLEKSITERESKQFDRSMKSLQNAFEFEELTPKIKRKEEHRINCLNALALIYLDTGQKKKALQVFDNELKKTGIKDRYLCNLASNAFNPLAQKGLYEEALNYAKQGYNASLSLNENELKYVALDNLACGYMYLNEIDSANHYINLAFELLTDVPGLPNIESLIHSDNKKWICNLLYDQARIYKRDYDVGSKIKSLNLAKLTLMKLDSLIAYYLDDQILTGSVVQLRREISKYYSLATDVCYQLNDLEGFLFFSEKNRGLLLLDKLVDPTYSDELIAQNLRDSINTLEENKFNLDYLFSMNPTDSLKRIKTAVEAEILSYQTKLKSLRSFNPSKIADVAQLLKNPTDETFYYQFGDSSLYLLYLSPEGNHLKEISEKIELVKLLSAYDKNLKAGRTMTFDKSLSSQLFQILFSDYYSGQEQMTIVPHGELSFLPFESLMTSNGKFLVEESSLSYAISLTLQQEWRKTKGKVKEIHVISPIYDSIYMETNESKSRGSINFDFLAYSQMEAKNIAELLDANLIEEATVDKELVKNSMATADIFHFSGHSYLTENDNQFTFMALGHNYTDPDHTFSVAEVFHQDTHAEMVFLNACNTAKSDLINGEGVYNLSRAFLSSGSKSVVSTLWEVDDKASGEISIVFYENLKDGMSKANALQQAKNNYLQNVTKDNQRHPYYWAGIVLVGNPDSLTFHNNSLTYILAAIGILLLGGIWFLKKRSIHPG